MMKRFFTPSFIAVRCRRETQGAALIVTLSFVVLLAVIVVAFLARSISQRKVEAAGAGHQQADLLARDAVRIVLDDLQKEITAGSEQLATYHYYQPKTVETMLPARAVAPALGMGSPVAPGSPFHRLLKQSGVGRFFPAGAPYEATPEPLLSFESAVLSTSPASSGQWVALERWNAARLLLGDGFEQGDEAPRWIYTDRDLGPVRATLAAKELTGRFAFNLYDVSGLIDLNVAGAVSAVLSEELMGTAGGVEPRWLGNPTLVNELLEWRDRATAGSLAGYVDYVRRIGPGQGFLQTPAGDRRFMSRRDLILALEGKFAGLADLLPYVGHYSRHVAAPGLGMAAPTAANPHPVAIRRTNAVTLTAWKLDGQAVSYELPAGAPVMPLRFSLDRLQWLTHEGPLTPELAPAIRACFGLEWNAAQARWDYVGSDGASTVQDTILRLDEVAALAREPNFFEVLKAAINEGALGKAAATATLNPEQASHDQSKDLQVIRIGANIIDNGDADNFPTRLAFSVDGAVPVISGVEDLPYLWGAFPTILVAYSDNAAGAGATSQFPRHRADLVLTPHLFNPHQASAATPSAGPSDVRVRLEGELRRIQIRADATPSGGGGEIYYNYTTPTDLSSRPAIALPITSGSFRTVPDIPTAATSGPTSTASTRYAALLPHFGDTAMGFVLHSAVHNPPLEPGGTSTSPANVWLEGVNLVLEYQVAGQWIPYDRLTGVEGLPGGVMKEASDSFNLTSVGSRVVHVDSSGAFTQSFNNQNLTRSYLLKADPRSTRFSLAWNPSASYGGAVNGPANQMPAASVVFQQKFPFAGWAATQLRTLPQGGLTAGANPGQVADPDSVVRPADGYRSAQANPLTAGAYNTARPVILQRPYRSVAELGYVFRDEPWKTLDLSSVRSGDGALMEYFCTGESVPEKPGGGVMIPPLMAGRVNLNMATPTVLQTLLASALKEEGSLATRLSSGDAAGVAAILADSAQAPRMQSLGELAAWSNEGVQPLSAEHRATKRAVEQVTRGLAGNGQVRTWNLMLDVVAQSGKFPPQRVGGPLEQFSVEGEAHFWIFIAIDRLSGEVLEVRYEAPYE